MARQSILDRFRPVGAPGPGGSTGVPADDERGPEWELAPVFAALAPALLAAETALADADQSAIKSIAAATDAANHALQQARLDAGALRATTAARVLNDAQVHDTDDLNAAKERAAALEKRAQGRLTTASTRVIGALIEEITQP